MAERRRRRWSATVKTTSTSPLTGRMLILINRARRGLSKSRRAELERARRLLSERVRRDRERGKRKTTAWVRSGMHLGARGCASAGRDRYRTLLTEQQTVTAIRIVQQDIATLDVDAVVNAANDHLWMGAGVAGALKRAGGDEIEREAMAKGPIAVGEAVVTLAGRLRARHVIHAAVMGQDLRTSADAIRRATHAALARAEELRARVIAMPAFGTGVGGFPLDACARIMASEIRGHSGPLEEVVIAVRSDDAVRAFEGALGAS